MYKKLLLPLDLTDKHTQAIQTAAEFARQTGGTVTLLHVIELIQGLPREDDRAFYDRLEELAKAHLAKLGKGLTAPKISWQPAIVFGHRLEETVRYAAEHQCDLIIVTSPTFDPAKPTRGWGSMSFKVSVVASTPVLVVKD